MNAVADRTGIACMILLTVDGTEVHVGDRITVLHVEEPKPHHNNVDPSRIPLTA